ncbi:integumentary mucin C.1-like isoform X2 [Haliotis rufescens]|uniref:integumentary mucin C.1-like isoform X2 n=1 Tax=Haliotis rufescens TaxID=6454 RepID=UPI00201F4545|nr:integumentary mucin C.1-like isoform X2 [Haliotis rufescens]
MKTQCVIVLLLGLFPLIITGQQTAQRCEQDVNGCTAEFSLAQQVQSQSGFNLSAICSIVDEFMTCVNTVLAPCDVITKNTLRSAIDQLIGIYTNPPYGCTLNFAETFEYGNCSQQVTQCAFFKYAAEELKDNATEACKEFDGFVECMELNTTTCVGAEQTEIVQSIQNTTNTFNQCPYACNRPDLVCTTVTATTTLFTVSVLATPVMSSMAISDLDMSEYSEYPITPSEVFYNPSDVLSMYTADLSEFYNSDATSGTTFPNAILESEFPSESDYAGASDVAVAATETQTSMTTSQISTRTSSTSSTVSQTTLTSRTTPPSTSNSPDGTTTTSPPTTSSTTGQDTAKPTSHETKRSDKTSTSSATTTTSTTTTVRPTTTKATVKQQPTSTVDTTTTATTTTTTDFPTPNYDNAAVVKQVSAITVLASLVLAMMS